MRRIFAVTVVVLLVILAAAFAGGAWLLFDDDRLPVTSTQVDIAPGSTAASIARQLQAQGVIENAAALMAYLHLYGGGDRIQSAQYEFAPHLTIERVAKTLAAGGHPPSIWITIPEGFTAAQIAARLQAAGLAPSSAFEAAAHSRFLVLGGVATRGLEGYLFPDTYEIPRGDDARQIAGIMTAQFERELPPDATALARSLGVTLPGAVTIASMIEHEAKIDRERPLIASVIYNRLRLGMALEIDATIEYALPHHKTALSFADLALDSPYNTYKHAGLPPTPIGNPGRASLLAALHPARTPYLYYVYKGGGQHAFSTTLEEQQANERRFLP